jgi:alkylated DNA repair dioxygenase AlkB
MNALFPDRSLPAGFQLSSFLPADEAATFLAWLDATTPWEAHRMYLYGRSVRVPRQVAWYGPVPYTYSQISHPARPLPPLLQSLLQRVCDATGYAFNAVLCNRYADGNDSVSWHSDTDYAVGATAAVASLSFGATRAFDVRPIAPDFCPSQRMLLHAGDLLVMAPEVQTAWVHQIPKSPTPVGMRVNLTFRAVATQGEA